MQADNYSNSRIIITEKANYFAFFWVFSGNPRMCIFIYFPISTFVLRECTAALNNKINGITNSGCKAAPHYQRRNYYGKHCNRRTRQNLNSDTSSRILRYVAFVPLQTDSQSHTCLFQTKTARCSIFSKVI